MNDVLLGLMDLDGIVSYEYNVNQFEKCLMENHNHALEIAKNVINSYLIGISVIELTSRITVTEKQEKEIVAKQRIW